MMCDEDLAFVEQLPTNQWEVSKLTEGIEVTASGFLEWVNVMSQYRDRLKQKDQT